MVYGCKPPQIDVRDYKLAKSTNTMALPAAYECKKLPKVKNQGYVNSCVAHATSSILEYHDSSKNNLSTNFIYGIQKKLCNQFGQGMYLSDACKIVSKYGDMLHNDCSGNDEVPRAHTIAESSFVDSSKLDKAIEFKVESYYNCNKEFDTKKAIYLHGPVLASIKWYDTFKVGESGVLNGARTGDYGYHAIMVYGWNEQGFLCQNSWGDDWGNDGRFILPYYIGLAEAKGLIDYKSENKDVVKPVKTNNLLDILYKLLNSLLNLFKK